MDKVKTLPASLSIIGVRVTSLPLFASEHVERRGTIY